MAPELSQTKPASESDVIRSPASASSSRVEKCEAFSSLMKQVQKQMKRKMKPKMRMMPKMKMMPKMNLKENMEVASRVK